MAAGAFSVWIILREDIVLGMIRVFNFNGLWGMMWWYRWWNLIGIWKEKIKETKIKRKKKKN